MGITSGRGSASRPVLRRRVEVYPKLREIATYLGANVGIYDRAEPWPFAYDVRGILKMSAVRLYSRRPVLRRRREIYAQSSRRPSGLYSNFDLNCAFIGRRRSRPRPRAPAGTNTPYPKNTRNHHNQRMDKPNTERDQNPQTDETTASAEHY